MNISESGLFVATDVELPVGSYVSLHLRLGDTRILALAQVRWTRPYQDGRDDVPPGLGLEWVALDDAQASRIAAFVASHTR